MGAEMIMVTTMKMITATEVIMETTVQSMVVMEMEEIPEPVMAVVSTAVTATVTMMVMITMAVTMVETETEITNHQITSQRNQKIQRSQISQVTKHVTGDVISDLTFSPLLNDCDVIFTPI